MRATHALRRARQRQRLPDGEQPSAQDAQAGLEPAPAVRGPRNEYLVELQAKYVECMKILQAQQGVIEMRQDEMETLQAGVAELAARYDALLERCAALQAAQAVAPPNAPAQPLTSMVSHESPPTCT